MVGRLHHHLLQLAGIQALAFAKIQPDGCGKASAGSRRFRKMTDKKGHHYSISGSSSSLAALLLSILFLREMTTKRKTSGWICLAICIRRNQSP